MHWLQSIHTLPVFHFGPCAICDQSSQHGKERDWFAWQCWYFSGLGTEERQLTKLFQCAYHQLLNHNWPYILSPFFYPMWVQPWVKHIKNLIWYISTVFEVDTFRRHLQVANLKSVHPIESWLVKREWPVYRRPHSLRKKSIFLWGRGDDCTQAKRELTESVCFWCHQFARL